MKNYIVIVTSLGLWAGLLLHVEAQQSAAALGAADPNMLTVQGSQVAYAPIWSSAPRAETTSTFGWATDAREGEGPVSVMTFKSPDQTNLDETAQDLNILSYIFSQNLERALGVEGGESEDYKLGIPMLLQTGGHWVEASYIEGFGAIFNLKVRFPLVLAAVTNKDAQTPQVDSEWEQARRAIAGVAPVDPSRQSSYDNSYAKARRYSPKLVETLKKRVLELLKNASNLRHVQPDEWVAVTFAGPPNGLMHTRRGAGRSFSGTLPPGSPLGAFGDIFQGQPDAALAPGVLPAGGASPSAPVPIASSGAMAGQPTAPQSVGVVIMPPGASGTISAAPQTAAAAGATSGGGGSSTTAPQVPDRATMMTIRVKKRDADAFAANKMTEEQFFHAAEITTYLGPVIVNRANSDYYRILAR